MATRAFWRFDRSDTGETRELRPNLVYLDQISWAPDSHALVTGGTDLKGRNWVLQIDARTGDVTTIVPLPHSFERSFPQWSPDGKRIYYRFPLTGGPTMERDVAFIERDPGSGAERKSLAATWVPSASPRTAVGSRLRRRSVHAIPAHWLIIRLEGGETRELLRDKRSRSGSSTFVRHTLDAGQPQRHRAKNPGGA